MLGHKQCQVQIPCAKPERWPSAQIKASNRSSVEVDMITARIGSTGTTRCQGISESKTTAAVLRSDSTRPQCTVSLPICVLEQMTCSRTPNKQRLHLGVEGVGEAGHAAADALVGLRLRVVSGQQEGGEPARLAPVAVPATDGNQVKRVPQPLAVVPEHSPLQQFSSCDGLQRNCMSDRPEP